MSAGHACFAPTLAAQLEERSAPSNPAFRNRIVPAGGRAVVAVTDAIAAIRTASSRHRGDRLALLPSYSDSADRRRGGCHAASLLRRGRGQLNPVAMAA
jgi:hypothetical protein